MKEWKNKKEVQLLNRNLLSDHWCHLWLWELWLQWLNVSKGLFLHSHTEPYSCGVRWGKSAKGSINWSNGIQFCVHQLEAIRKYLTTATKSAQSPWSKGGPGLQGKKHSWSPEAQQWRQYTTASFGLLTKRTTRKTVSLRFFFSTLVTKYLWLESQTNKWHLKIYYMIIYTWRETLKMKIKQQEEATALWGFLLLFFPSLSK